MDDRIAVITGAASGMGRASAEALAGEGATVVVADIDAGQAEAVAQQIRDSGGRAVSHGVDVASPKELESLFGFVDGQFGELDVLFSHAGVQGPVGLDVSEEQFDRVVDINVKSHFFCTVHALPLLRRSRTGASIIYTSSTAALRGMPRSPVYGMAKAAILSLMRSMAVMLGPEGIRANAICPGAVETAFSSKFAASVGMDEKEIERQLAQRTPLGRIGQPADVADVVVFLASDRSRYMTGTAIPIDGGSTA